MIKAIETRYDGHKFRSRIEARWAVFFNSMDIQYLYEPEGFELPSGDRYLPDFYLPGVGMRSTADTGVWIEVKSHIENDHSWSGEPFDTLTKFSQAKGQPIALFVGEVGNGMQNKVDIYEINNRAVDWPMTIVKCRSCGSVKIEFQEGNYMHCEKCDSGVAGYNLHREKPGELIIKGAVDDANYARFEHGEHP